MAWDYIYHDAQKTVKDETGRDPIHINLAPIPGVTDEDFRNGSVGLDTGLFTAIILVAKLSSIVCRVNLLQIASANRKASQRSKSNFAKARQAAKLQAADRQWYDRNW
jgi:hypothetical protein